MDARNVWGPPNDPWNWTFLFLPTPCSYVPGLNRKKQRHKLEKRNLNANKKWTYTNYIKCDYTLFSFKFCYLLCHVEAGLDLKINYELKINFLRIWLSIIIFSVYKQIKLESATVCLPNLFDNFKVFNWFCVIFGVFFKVYNSIISIIFALIQDFL